MKCALVRARVRVRVRVRASSRSSLTLTRTLTITLPLPLPLPLPLTLALPLTRFDRGFISPYFATNPKTQKAEFENPFILLVEKKVSTLQSLLPLLEQVRMRG